MSNPRTIKEVPFGMITLPGELRSAFPLERTRVTGQITGSIASLMVEQHFRNELSQAAEIEYLFPLPETAAVFGFELRLGERNVHGEIQELEQARERYDFAKHSGQQAALVEQRRPNLFAVKVANVLPGKPVIASLRYTDALRYVDNQWEFIFPMGLTPRYHAPGHPQEAEGTDFPVAARGEDIGPVEISLALNCGLDCPEPTSPSHDLRVQRLDAGRFQVALAEQAIPDHDLVLRFGSALDQYRVTAYRHSDAEGDTFLINLLPTLPFDQMRLPPQREFIFVLDRSGSMMGEPIAQARNALRASLRALSPDDTFRILLFDNEMEWYQLEPAALSQEALDEVDAYLSGVEGRGGTDIITALESALSVPASRKHERYVVFLTDGAVSAEARALEQVRRHIGKARLFTFGIGPSVNRALLRQLATLGRGASELLQLDEDIEGAIIRFQDRVSFPVTTDLSLEWASAKVWDVSPARLPDLYRGDPITVTGKMAAEEGTRPVAILRGKEDGANVRYEQEIMLVEEPAIARLWARGRIQEIIDRRDMGELSPEAARDEFLRLALRHQLLSPVTALVAVDDEIVAAGGQPVVIAVAQPLPQGLDMAGFQAAMPPSSMPMPRGFNPLVNAMQSFSAPARAKNAPRQLQESAAPTPELALRREDVLRALARAQRANGSWDDDVEFTSSALLAFVRNGHTTHAGTFRRQLSKAAAWLATAQATGRAASMRAVVLSELAQKTGSQEQQALAESAAQAAPPVQPAGDFPALVESIELLRDAALVNRAVSISPRLLRDRSRLLILAWAASIPQA